MQHTEAAGGPLALKYIFILASFLKLARGCENMNDQLFECSALSPSLQKKFVKSCNVNVVQSLAWDKKIK